MEAIVALEQLTYWQIATWPTGGKPSCSILSLSDFYLSDCFNVSGHFVRFVIVCLLQLLLLYCCVWLWFSFVLFCFVLFCFPTPSWICLSISALEASAQLHSKRQFHCLGGFRKCVIISERLTFESAINLISGNGRATWMTHSNEVAVKWISLQWNLLRSLSNSSVQIMMAHLSTQFKSTGWMATIFNRIGAQPLHESTAARWSGQRRWRQLSKLNAILNRIWLYYRSGQQRHLMEMSRRNTLGRVSYSTTINHKKMQSNN